MARKRATANVQQYPVQVGSRGRLVLPGARRHELDLRPGDRLVLIVDQSGEARLVSAREQIDKYRGMLARKARGRRLSEELIAERRADFRREEKA